MGSAAVDAVRQSHFMEMLHGAIETAASRPSFGDEIGQQRSGLTEGTSGRVGAEKLDFVSSVERPGATPRAEAPEASSSDHLEERMMSMYSDLTNYQIAWKIAQRIQQDVSQLMKGQ
jgi:hypothetical protein